MAIDDKIKALTKQLYPTGRVWRINPNSIKEKFINGLLASEIRAYNDGVSILDSALPDNANFTVDDASAWEKRLGLVDGTGTSLQDRMDAIKVQLNWPGTNPAKGAADYIQSVLQAAGYNTCVQENLFFLEGTWASANGAANTSWDSVAYGNGTFVAVSQSSNVMTSPDGITWTLRTGSISVAYGVTFGNGLFVACGVNSIMTSPDGITWTSRSCPSLSWISIAFGNGIFVACANQVGGPNNVITSPDGITWTSRTFTYATDTIGFGNGLFVIGGAANKVSTSPDGITWTDRSIPTTGASIVCSVTFGDGLFVALVLFGSPQLIITSSDGITWTNRVATNSDNWISVAFGNGIFNAVSIQGHIMTSSDGITWSSSVSPQLNHWNFVCFGNNIFVAVSSNGYPTNVMYTGAGSYFHKTYAQFAGTNLVRHVITLLHGQQRHGYLSQKGVIVANSVDPSVDDNFDIGDGSDTIFIGGCPPGTFINIPKEQETAFRQFILKIKPVNITVLLLVNFV